MPSYFRISQEFAVNSRTAANQTGPSVATLTDGAFVNGGFVIVWVSQDATEDGDGSAIKGQFYDPYGNPRGGEFLVNSAGTGSQFNPSVTGLGYSGFVVTWTSNDPAQDGSGNAIKAQLFARDGTPRGTEFLVNTQATSSQANPVVTHLTSGDFVISWDDWNGFDRKAQIFDYNGVKLGAEFRLNTNTAGMEEYGDIVGLTYGGFVATWRTTDPSGDGSGEAVKGQVFSNTGVKIGGEFRVNTATAGNQNDPSVTALAFGGFVVVWATGDPAQDGSGGAVKAQMFDSSGNKVGGELLVNTQAADTQREPVVTATNDGGFFVAWTSFNTAQDGSSFAIKGQAFSASGTRQGAEMLINTLSAGAQFIPDIATFDDGRIVLTWASESGDGDGYSVRAQILEPNQRPRITSGGGGTSSMGLYVDEGETLATTVVAVDPDGPNPLHYSITGGYDAHLFFIDSATGQLYFRNAPDYEAPFQGQNFYSVYVTVDDGELSTFQLVQIGVRNVYEDVHFDQPSRAFSIAENGTAIGILEAVRDDQYGLYYSIAGGVDAHLFTIDMWTGALSFASAPDHEIAGDANWDNVYEVTISASDGVTSAVQQVSVTVDDVDEGVSFFSHGGAAVVALTKGENVYWVDQVVAFAEEGEVIYSIGGGADAALFTVDPVTGELTFLYEARPDYEAPTDSDGDGVYEVIVAASANGSTATQAFEVTIANHNEGVWITSNGGDWWAAVSVAENSGAVTTVTAYDPDSTVPIFQIVGGADAGLFTIDPETGALSFISAPDFEAPTDSNGDNVYHVMVAANDGDYATAQDLFVAVTNVDDSVDIVSDGGADIVINFRPENDAAGADIDAVDGLGRPIAYSITGGADSALFAIDPATGALSFLAAPDFELPADADGDNSYEVIVTASSGGSTDTQTFWFVIDNVNEAVVITSNGGGAGASLAANENQRAVATIVAEDLDGTVPTFAIVGGADAARFTIDAATGVLQFVSAPDREAPGDADGDNVYDVVVRATDGSLFDDQALAVTVANVDEGLAITSYGGIDTVQLTRSENGSAVGQVAAADQDGDPVTYAIVGGADAGRFQVDPVTGALSFVSSPDFEAPADADGDNVYKVEVAAISGAFSDTQAFAVAVTNANEALAITSNGGGATASVAVAENGLGVTTVASFDPDGTPATYSIVGGADAARFTINPQTGALQFVAAPDHETPADANGDNVYSVIVQAGDGQFTDLQTLSVSILNLRDGATVTGTNGGDSISGTSTNPALRTTNAEDSVSGRDGHDTILGLGGDDWLNGDAGNDVLNGGAGADRLTGGLGKDQFVYNAVTDSTPTARDVLTDFSRSQNDKISLSAIDANSVVSGNQSFTFIGAAAFSGVAGQLRYATSGGVTLVSGDVNGDGVADFQIELSVPITPVASDFVL